MPELPEITCRARELNEILRGHRVTEIEVAQPKCLDRPVEEFRAAVVDNLFLRVTHHGKWLICELDRGALLINLGMGGELLWVRSERVPDKWRVRLAMEDTCQLVINFWWFGYVHIIESKDLSSHPMLAKLGPDALELDQSGFIDLLAGRRGRIKPFLLDQSKIAGIGNAYIHDILFRACIHPLRPIPSLEEDEIEDLYSAMGDELRRSIDKGGAFYELDLFGNRGGFTADDLLIGYREGKACPTCGTMVEKIKTGSTSGFICPHCQPFER